jgi:hypothetical protein
LKESGDSDVDLGGGQVITLPGEAKEKFVERLDKLAISGDLRMPDGEPIINVEMIDAPGWGTGDMLSIETAGSEEPLVFDPNNAEDLARFQEILDMNSSYLISPESWEKSRTPYINSGKIQPGDAGAAGTVNVDTQAQARSILEMYEKSKKQPKK